MMMVMMIFGKNMVMVFGKNKLKVKYLHIKAPSQMLDRVLNRHLIYLTELMFYHTKTLAKVTKV